MGIWNELLEEVVEAGSIMTFKRQLDRHIDGTGLEGYAPSAGRWDWCRRSLLVGMGK